MTPLLFIIDFFSWFMGILKVDKYKGTNHLWHKFLVPMQVLLEMPFSSWLWNKDRVLSTPSTRMPRSLSWTAWNFCLWSCYFKHFNSNDASSVPVVWTTVGSSVRQTKLVHTLRLRRVATSDHPLTSSLYAIVGKVRVGWLRIMDVCWARERTLTWYSFLIQVFSSAPSPLFFIT